MAVKIPPLLHKMSQSAQKAWYKKNNMEMPSTSAQTGGKSAAAAKRVKVAPRKASEVKPDSVRAINAARQAAYMAKGGRAPIGAAGSGGSSVMAGSNMSTAKGIVAGIKAGFNPKVSLSPYEGMTAKEKKAMKKEEVEQVDEARGYKIEPKESPVFKGSKANPMMRHFSVSVGNKEVGWLEHDKDDDTVRGSLHGKSVNISRHKGDTVADKFKSYINQMKEEAEQVDEGSKRMSAAVKLQRAFEREKASSDASRKRGEEMLAQARAEYAKKQAAKTNEEVEQVDEGAKEDAAELLGGPVKEKPKMPPGKQPAGYRYVRGLARKAMKDSMKKEEVEQIDEVNYKKYLKVSQEKRPLTPSAVAVAMSAEKEGNPDPARKLRNTQDARKFANKQLTKQVAKTRPAQKFPVYEPGRKYVGDSVELDGPVIDEANSRNSATAMQQALTPKASDVKAAVGTTARDKATTNKYARRISKLTGGDYSKQDVKDNLKSLKTEDTEMKYIEEKLTAADPASKWISDFVKSDNPKFAGKSKKERIQQALGAYYAAKRGTNEEVEQLDEIGDTPAGREALKSYTAKADTQVTQAWSKNRSRVTTDRVAAKRNVGILRAQNRLQSGTPLYAASMKKEEVEQIDEASLAKLAAAHWKNHSAAAYGGNEGYSEKQLNRYKEKADKILSDIRLAHGTDVSKAVEKHSKDAAEMENASAGHVDKNFHKNFANKVLGGVGSKNHETYKSYVDREGAYHHLDEETAGKKLAKAIMAKQSKHPIAQHMGEENIVEQDDATEKKEMAQTQLHFIKYAAEEILEFIEMGGEIEEWYQNKLSKVQSEVESLHSYIEGEKRRTGMVEDVVTEEGKVAVTPKEKSLAAHHGDKTKITYGDVIKARLKSAAAKKMGK